MWRANLDGTYRILLANIATPTIDGRIALDLPGGKLYWSDNDLDDINRMNLDGSGIQIKFLDPPAGATGGLAFEVIPEPNTFWLGLLGLSGLLLLLWRSRRS